MDEKFIKYLANQSKYYEDLYDILWKMNDVKEFKKEFSKVSVGLFNIPCGGFGDIIVCKTFYDYLKSWYPNMNVNICTSDPGKYDQLGVSKGVLKLHSKKQDIQCIDYNDLNFKNKTKFDLMIVIPIINKSFDIKKFQKCMPYANLFNTFTMSEYNGEFPPYTFPIGVGQDNLGILLNDFKTKEQNLIKKPYAMVYIQPSPEWGSHARYCFFAYLEMICEKYSKKHKRFQIVIPSWIEEDLEYNPQFTSKLRKIVKQYFKNIAIIYQNGDQQKLLEDENDKSFLILRADLLPQKREIFISLIRDSVPDVLLTGDQSITDAISCCKRKTIWYQIAPWKQGFAYHLNKELPNENFKTFKTSCGSLNAFEVDIDWKTFQKRYDFRIHGKKRMDLLLIGYDKFKKEKYLQDLLKIIEGSRFLETAQKKINKL